MIKIVQTKDVGLIKECYLDDYIFETIAEDGFDVNSFSPDMVNTVWVALYNDEDFMGIIEFNSQNSVSTQMHIGIFKRFRFIKAHIATKLTLKWLITNFKSCQKVIVFIPTIHANVKAFAIQNGFKEEGLNRSSYLKGGKVIDQWLFGITREEIECLV